MGLRVVQATLGCLALMAGLVGAPSAGSADDTAPGADTSATTAPPLTNRTPPGVEGVLRYGQVLRADRGWWSPRPERFRFRWLRDGEPIAGATGASYRIRPEDVGRRLRVRVTAIRAGYAPTEAVSAARGPVRHRVPARRVVRYHVETRGRITTSVRAFRRLVQQTYDDARGWRGAGIEFRQVRRGGAFTVVLAAANKVPAFHPICDSTWSCRVGRHVVINQERWKHASPAWNRAGLPLRDYRHMVVNHETGHWLGHGHASCPRRGAPAPVMMQQSKGRDGCRFNPWPTLRELRRTR